jgi:alpha(1,3/1,4) fucosyltransferase
VSDETRVALYIDPPSHHFRGDRLFEAGDAGFFNGDSVNAPYARLRDFLGRRGIPCRTADYLPAVPDDVRKIYVSMGALDHYRSLAKRPDVVLSAFFAMECPIAAPALYRGLPRAQESFKRIFSWSDSASLERFVGGPLRCTPFLWPQPFADVHEEIWRRTDRRFLVMINANKLPVLRWQELYTERLRAVEFFSRRGEVDLFGIGWDGPPFRLGIGWMPGTAQRIVYDLNKRWDRVRPDPLLSAARKAYRGRAASKREVLGQYKFSICFENMVLKGWITEKIFDCFYAGTVPIYRGAPDIDAHIPSGCFIDMREFKDYADLERFLHARSEDDLQRYRDQAREFLRSPKFRPFSTEAFIDLFTAIIGDDTGIPLDRTVPVC